eukprot:CAMPEP_0113591936 /NCGR_PEP_ID=MMETSP0015_2-20120614/37559_1 /TAXON_ID=2838 /ORGANISM="Odontella" /LENGTH=53 /DNA_ID=CAMNT_0000498399 /DNA_START=27 /DNA_END=188 /DNA_ORIENTATION=+ /assembly_acc=CAM_ASM_000160
MIFMVVVCGKCRNGCVQEVFRVVHADYDLSGREDEDFAWDWDCRPESETTQDM